MRLEGDRSIDRRKITEYLLDLDHLEGGPKAEFFTRRGFRRNAAKVLTDAIMAHPDMNEIELTETTEYGLKAVVRCTMQTPDGRNPCIRTVWLRDFGTTTYRFVTAYPTS